MRETVHKKPTLDYIPYFSKIIKYYKLLYDEDSFWIGCLVVFCKLLIAILEIIFLNIKTL